MFNAYKPSRRKKPIIEFNPFFSMATIAEPARRPPNRFVKNGPVRRLISIHLFRHLWKTGEFDGFCSTFL